MAVILAGAVGEHPGAPVVGEPLGVTDQFTPMDGYQA
jgi:hypothetical protein